MNPVLKALTALGGSGSVREIRAWVVTSERVPYAAASVLHNPNLNKQNTELEYRLTWARTFLKKFGLIRNSARGKWAITSKGKGLQEVDSREIVRVVRASAAKKRSQQSPAQ